MASSMAATTKMGLHFPENLSKTKLKKNMGMACKKILKVKENTIMRSRRVNLLCVVANSSSGYQGGAAATTTDIINGKKLNGIHVAGYEEKEKEKEKEKGKGIMRSSGRDGCMVGKFVEETFVYRQTFVIRSYEIGPDKTATMETLMNLLQETALNHVTGSGLAGDGFGATREMSLRKLIWVVTRIHIQVEKYSSWGDVVEIDTWVDAAGKNAMRRDWIIRDSTTRKIIARATSTWVIMNRETRRLCKIPEEVREEVQPFYLDRLAISAPPLNHNDKIDKLTDDTAARIRSGLAPRWSDMDANLHVNNVKYIGWILESVPVQVLERYNMRSMTLEYRRECRQSDLLESLTSIKANANANANQKEDHHSSADINNININSTDLVSTHLLRMNHDDKAEIIRARSEWHSKLKQHL